VAAKENKLICIPDVKDDKRYLNQDVAKKEGLCSLVCVPLAVKGRVIGVLNCYTSKNINFPRMNWICWSLSQPGGDRDRECGVGPALPFRGRSADYAQTYRAGQRLLSQDANVALSEAYRLIQKQSMNMLNPCARWRKQLAWQRIKNQEGLILVIIQ
jgi:hypothetical protein